MRSKRSAWLVLSSLVIVTLLAAACAPATGTPQATQPPAATTAAQDTQAPAPTVAPQPTTAATEGTATITFVQEPDSLNPYYSEMFFSFILTQFYLKSLWSFDAKNQPVPEIAAEIPTTENGAVTADGKTVTVKLRSDVTWSDGEPVTADDFVFTFDMIMSDKNLVLSRYPYEDFVESVSATDPQTLVINFKDSFAPWLTTVFSYVLPKHVLQPVFDTDGTLDNAAWNKAPTVGVGPYVFKEWQSGSHIIFTANPNWIKQAKVGQIFIRIVPDDAAQEAAILAGDTDIGVFLSSDQIPRLEADGTVDVVANPSGYDEGWFLNVNPATAHPAMLDLNVRKALALATDRFTLVNDLLDPTVNPVNVTFWDATAPFGDESLEPYPYDPAEAEKLLDAAGWIDSNGDGIRDKDGEELILRYATNQRELRMNYQAVVQQQLKSVGIGVELNNHSSDIFWNSYTDGGPQAKGEYDIAQYSSVGSFPDPEASQNWLCSEISSAENPDGSNWQGYCNPDLDKLLKEQAITLDREKRIDLYHQIEKIMYDEYIYVGIWLDPDLYSINKRLQNVTLSGATPFWNAADWTVIP